MDRITRVRTILSTRGVTLFHVSRRSAEIFGRSSQFYIPHNLYYDLAHSLATPTIFQFLALSHITGYRLTDWLAALGFDLDAIARLQLQIPWQHTTILDSTVFDGHAWVPWFAQRAGTAFPSSIAPLGHFLTWAPPIRAKDLLATTRRKFLYAMVGERDLYAVPYFVPRSIVRVNPEGREELDVVRNRNSEGPFFLVEHESGWTCSRVVQLGRDRVLLHCPQRPCAEREIRIGKYARILGRIDAEIRPLIRGHHSAGVAAQPATPGKPKITRPFSRQASLKDLLLHSRVKVGLSFRAGSLISRRIAGTLSDELYFAAPSTLSDYEALSGPPRHVQKIITLSLLYRIGFERLLGASGLPLGMAGREPIPDDLVPRHLPPQNQNRGSGGLASAIEAGALVTAPINLWEEIPLFLRFSLDEITGLRNFSLSDVFWSSGAAQLHPLLANSTLVAVNRRARKPPRDTGKAVCGEALYLIFTRNGRYLCGRCTLDDGNLVIHGYPGGSVAPQQFRNGADAEVVGQVTAVLRRLL